MIEPIDCKVRITGGEHAGRYIGPNFAGGLVTKPEKDMPRRIEGTKYSSYPQERGANTFTKTTAAAAQAELQQAGYASEAVKVS
jgi:hypothetical protein